VAWCYVLYFYRSSQSTTAQARIILLFLQMALLVFGSETGWLSWANFLDMSPFESGNGSCIFPMSPMFQLLLGLWSPFVCLALLWLTYLIRLCLSATLPRCCAGRIQSDSVVPLSVPTTPSALEEPMTGSKPLYAIRSPTITSSSPSSPPSLSFSLSACWRSPSKCSYVFHHAIFDANLFNKHVRTSVALLLFSYNSFVNTLFKYVDCTQLDENSSFVTSIPAISCESAEYRSVFPLIVCLIILVVGLPVVTMIVLVRMKLKARLDQPTTILRYGVLFQYYRPSIYFWVCLRLHCFVSIPV
jgi:hypothetical protein